MNAEIAYSVSEGRVTREIGSISPVPVSGTLLSEPIPHKRACIWGARCSTLLQSQSFIAGDPGWEIGIPLFFFVYLKAIFYSLIKAGPLKVPLEGVPILFYFLLDKDLRTYYKRG